MKTYLWLALLIVCCGHVFAARTEEPKADATPKEGLEAAKAITKITGIAISPLLGTGAVGAWDFFTTPKEKHAKLPWYALPSFWVPTLLLCAAVAAKDAFGTVLPPRPYAVGRGLFYPEIRKLADDTEDTLLILPPRYKSHEDAVATAYGIAEVRDVGLLKGFKAIWRWLKTLFGGVEPQPATT